MKYRTLEKILKDYETKMRKEASKIQNICSRTELEEVLVCLFQNQNNKLSPPQKEYWSVFHIFTEQLIAHCNTSTYT